jgi:hypothetical protein
MIFLHKRKRDHYCDLSATAKAWSVLWFFCNSESVRIIMIFLQQRTRDHHCDLSAKRERDHHYDLSATRKVWSSLWSFCKAKAWSSLWSFCTSEGVIIIVIFLRQRMRGHHYDNNDEPTRTNICFRVEAVCKGCFRIEPLISNLCFSHVTCRARWRARMKYLLWALTLSLSSAAESLVPRLTLISLSSRTDEMDMPWHRVPWSVTCKGKAPALAKPCHWPMGTKIFSARYGHAIIRVTADPRAG